MNRRDTVLALLVLGVAPQATKAQTAPKVYRIGVLSLFQPKVRWDQIADALRVVGYEERRNVTFEIRFADGKTELLPNLAEDLVRKKVDLIVAFSNLETLAAKKATTTIPIVMVFTLVPVESGLISSLSRPGGNITGTTLQGPETAGKILQVLRDAVPGVNRVAILFEPDYPGMDLYRRATERAAALMGIRLTLLSCQSMAELDASLIRVTRERPDALYIVPTGPIFTYRARVIEFAARQRLPAIYTAKFPVPEGGLLSYSQDQTVLVHRTAAIIDRILKGANPAELPVEQPTKFELVINLKTAKALGITFPGSVLIRADEVIQ